jgi:hypothetical protein
VTAAAKAAARFLNGPCGVGRLRYGVADGGTRRFVACSKAWASSIRRSSLQAIPVKLTPNGIGIASKPSGNGGVGAFGTIPKGTITEG